MQRRTRAPRGRSRGARAWGLAGSIPLRRGTETADLYVSIQPCARLEPLLLMLSGFSPLPSTRGHRRGPSSSRPSRLCRKSRHTGRDKHQEQPATLGALRLPCAPRKSSRLLRASERSGSGPSWRRRSTTAGRRGGSRWPTAGCRLRQRRRCTPSTRSSTPTTRQRRPIRPAAHLRLPLDLHPAAARSTRARIRLPRRPIASPTMSPTHLRTREGRTRGGGDEALARRRRTHRTSPPRLACTIRTLIMLIASPRFMGRN